MAVAGAGYLAVNLFFVLSGYVLARRYLAVSLGAHRLLEEPGRRLLTRWLTPT